MRWIETYFSEIYRLSLEMSPWLLLGFTFAGLLHIFMPGGSVRKYMGGRNLKSVVYAALLGVPLPLCSCGVIPTGISFHKEGASKGATVSFLISTPQTGVDSILATYSMMGLPFAILRPVVAFCSGIFGGLLTNLTTKNEADPPVSRGVGNESEIGSGNKLRIMLRYAFLDFLMDIADWLLIGFAVAALISLLLPDNFFTMYLSNQFLSMLVVLVAAIPLYVCATGSIPIAAVLMMKGLSPGAALVFLMAGPATNIATMAIIGKAIDKKTVGIYILSISVSALFFGWLINNFLPAEWFVMMSHQHGRHEHELLPHWVQLASTVLLLMLLINGYVRKFVRFKHLKPLPDMTQYTKNLKISVGGMTCNHCKMSVEKNLKSVTGIKSVTANPDTGDVLIEGSEFDLEKIKSAIEDIGYDFKGVREDSEK
jgi:uncharacterized membrane protein YraQ (UPF0718 family)/copper chaperone CopZ